MKNCYDVISVFQSFSHEITNKFGTSIKILHTNNARKYLSVQFVFSSIARNSPSKFLCSTTTNWCCRTEKASPSWNNVHPYNCMLLNQLHALIHPQQSNHVLFFCTHNRTSILFLFVSSVVLVLSMIFPQVKINFLPSLLSV